MNSIIQQATRPRQCLAPGPPWRHLQTGNRIKRLVLLALAGSLFVIALKAYAADPELRTATRHPIQYYLSVPSWPKPETGWWLVIGAEGSGKAWLDNARRYAIVRDQNKYPFIIATPLILTNGGTDLRHYPKYSYASSVWDRVDREGNCNFDLSGLDAIAMDIQEQYGVASKYFMAGWSAGGHLVWASVFRRPEKLMAAALSVPNYIGRCTTDDPLIRTFSDSPAKTTLPVAVFEGALDKSLQKQIDAAVFLARGQGYRNLTREVVPQRGHDMMEDKALEFFNSVLHSGR